MRIWPRYLVQIFPVYKCGEGEGDSPTDLLLIAQAKLPAMQYTLVLYTG